MPSSAYVGIPRSGKSYEVVSNVIVPALAQGRRVVSNIAGLNYDEIKKYLIEKGTSLEKIGDLVLVTPEQILDAHFFKTDEDDQHGIESFIQAGDQLALDECWRFWKKRGEIPARHQNFFRMHGHFVNAKTGYVCQIALISQDIGDINENIRSLLDSTYRMTKADNVGLDKRYRVDVFQRGSVLKKDFLHSQKLKTYNPVFFPMYKSHSKNEGDKTADESKVDNRGNIFTGNFFKVVLPLMFIVGCFGLYKAWMFFHPEKPVVSTTQKLPTVEPSAALPRSAPQAEVPVAPWRVSGSYRVGPSRVFLLADLNGHTRQLINPMNYQTAGHEIAILLPEGGMATTYAYPQSQSKSPL